jgi:hypothetical protein
MVQVLVAVRVYGVRYVSTATNAGLLRRYSMENSPSCAPWFRQVIIQASKSWNAMVNTMLQRQVPPQQATRPLQKEWWGTSATLAPLSLRLDPRNGTSARSIYAFIILFNRPPHALGPHE